MRREPGEVWFLPPEAEDGGDPKGRRHVLLTPWDDVDEEAGMFSYASTQATEARFGAAHLFVDPATSRSPHSGFTRPTYIYPSRLVRALPEDLLRMTGRLVAEMPELRQALGIALGLGHAATATSNAQGWRGRVVRFAPRRSAAIDYEFGIVVTEPAYSRRERYQLVIPVDDLDEFEAEPGDLVIEEPAWLPVQMTNWRGVLIAVPDLQAVFHPLDIDSWTGAVVDHATVEDIERGLMRLFGL